MLLLNKKKICVESDTTPYTIDSTTDQDYTDSTVDYHTSTDVMTGILNKLYYCKTFVFSHLKIVARLPEFHNMFIIFLLLLFL